MTSLTKLSSLWSNAKHSHQKLLTVVNNFILGSRPINTICHKRSVFTAKSTQPNSINQLFAPSIRTFKSKTRPTAKKSKLLPFEQNRYVEKDTVLYVRPTNTPWQYLGVVGATMCGCMWVWAYNQWFYVDLTRQRKIQGNIKNEHYAYEFITSDTFKYISCSWLVIFGVAAFALSLLYPLRIVQKVTLRSGGESLRIITYGHLKLSKQHLVRMDRVSCTLTRQNANPYVRINVVGKSSGFLLDSSVGKFPEPELFDKALASVQSK